MKYNGFNSSEVTWTEGNQIPSIQLTNIFTHVWTILANEVNDTEVEKENKKDFTVRDLKNFDILLEVAFPEPVYIKKGDGIEQIVCITKIMEPNKMYDIIWNKEKYGVMKTAKGVQLFEFIPNEPQND